MELRLTALEGEKEGKKKKIEGDEERRNVCNKNQVSTATISDEHDLNLAAAGADSTGKIAIKASENCHILSHTMALATKACKGTPAPKFENLILKVKKYLKRVAS